MFEVRGAPQIYYGAIAVVSADNPASNSLGGFKESVAAYRDCRQCKTNDSNAQVEVYHVNNNFYCARFMCHC